MEFDPIIKRAAIGATVNLSLQEIASDPRRSMKNMVDLFGYMAADIFGDNIMAKIRREAENPKSCFYRMVTSMVQNVDHSILKTVGTNMCFNRMAIISETKRTFPAKMAKIDLPLSIEHLRRAVEHAKKRGIYFFILCGVRPLHFQDKLFDLCRKNGDCVFYITAEENDINDTLAKNVVQTKNIILSVRITTNINPERVAYRYRHVFQILKNQKCLFGYIAEIGSGSSKACCSDGFIQCMAKFGCLFGWYYIPKSEQKVVSCQRAVSKLMNSALTSRSKPLLLLNSQTDRKILRRFVTGGRCYFIFSDHGIQCRSFAAKRS